MVYAPIKKLPGFFKTAKSKAANLTEENTDNLVENSLRSAGDYAGVFEYDGETSYFYLYSTTEQKILGAIPVSTDNTDIRQASIEVRWDQNENKVAVFVNTQILAMFNLKDGISFENDIAALALLNFAKRNTYN